MTATFKGRVALVTGASRVVTRPAPSDTIPRMAEAKPGWFENLQAPVLPRELKIRHAMELARMLETDSRVELEEDARRLASEPLDSSISHLPADFRGRISARSAISREAYRFALANEPLLAGQWKAAFLGSFPPGLAGLAERMHAKDNLWLEVILGGMFLAHALRGEDLPPELKERLRRLEPPGE